jgi:1-acyl-sn-glycerol-3-phosphate acyltransferase
VTRERPGRAGTARLGLYPRAAAFVCRAVLRCVTRVRVEGLEHVRIDGPLIVVSNHISNADPPFVGGWLTPALGRRPRFLAKEQLFKGPAGTFLRSQGVIPVRAGGSDVEAYRVAKGLLDADEVLVIFPEGTRSLDGELQEPKPGAAMLAIRTGATILPAGVSGTDRFLRRGTRMPRIGARITLRFGEPFHLELDRSLDRRAGMDAASTELMRRIAALVDPRHRGRYEAWPRD